MIGVQRRASKAASDIDRSVSKLLRQKVYVGVPASSMSSDSKVSNAVIAYVQDQGDEALHIPARPFLEPGVRDAAPKIATAMEQAAAAAIRNDASGVDRGLNAVGLVCQAAVKARMVAGPFAPLAPATIYSRQHRTELPTKSTAPLLDTRSLFNAVTYVVGED